MDIYKILETMQKFAGEPDQKSGDQVRGTEKATTKASGEHPFKNRLVGGCAEAVEQECNQPMTLADKLKARWEETKRQTGLQEYGMTTGGTATGASAPGAPATGQADPAAQAKQVAAVQQNVNKLKSAGANIPNVNQAVQSISKDPATSPVTAQDKQVAGGLGQEIEQLAKGDPNTVNQLATLIQKSKQQGGAQ